MTQRTLNSIDRLIDGFDHALRTITGGTQAGTERPSPAHDMPEPDLTRRERKRAAALMRVNHTGEVCAQALYQGQALTAKLPTVRAEMEQAAAEEIDHLVWCEARVKELGSHTSYLNPVWYGLSFTLGAGAGLISDRVSLGFVAATEDRVCRHLEEHLQRLPVDDDKSRRIVAQMLEDEAKHGQAALDAGGMVFPRPVKAAMGLVSKVMTESSYRV
ncbi:2-polyprenyl-3-methyl-6-methoxy-1,4-benzoquinone monooxygenase [Marinimicrobium alkaliphilum]|uniref:2-polyprenyl-3-methyl-6-methoxy-1,4-benzoquinone monooxygenase n=1 Tax=Marinimicrobium alkaliphilum TaxID=2202654 RepID=UPI000DB91324|nr:2-polyprenyl-3-methyl-6-methoxy-1,4-benzoquinone monooxygenase [Marinimicrobium alkaliphilum]